MSALSNPTQHDHLLNYQLKRLLTIGGAPAIRLCEGRYGIARQEWRLVAALVEHGPLSPGELARESHIEFARVSRTIKSLNAKGLVERVTVSNDRRRASLAATDKGQQLYRELFPQLAAINARLMTVLTTAEAVLLEDFLARLTARAEAVHAAGDGVPVKTGRHLGGSRRIWEGTH
jgi:DNA-binding MarR family transcriptional regulator